MRKVRHRGQRKVDWIFVFAAAAYNLVHIRNLSGARMSMDPDTHSGALRTHREP